MKSSEARVLDHAHVSHANYWLLSVKQAEKQDSELVQSSSYQEICMYRHVCWRLLVKFL